MTRGFCFFTLGLLLLNMSSVHAQVDTLDEARRMRDSGNIEAAASLLQSYNRNHPVDVNALWLYAQSEYWLEHFESAESLYTRAVQLQPENYYLHLDYGKVLIDIGELVDAASVLSHYDVDDTAFAAAHVLLARIAYWQGDYVRASALLDRTANAGPPGAEAEVLRSEIRFVRSPLIRLSTAYSGDTQPLHSITASVEGRLFLHPLSTVRFAFRSPAFFKENKALVAHWLQVGNTASFQRAGLEIDINAGALSHPYRRTILWTAQLELRQILTRNLLVDAMAAHTPYFNTLSSLDTTLFVNTGALSVACGNPDRWSGKAGIEVTQFPDRNTLASVYAWFLTPPLSVAIASLRIGYGYGFSDARENRFVAKEPLAQIVATYNPLGGIAGVYQPYFTPRQQQVHSLLTSFEAHPAVGLDVGVKLNIGLNAHAQQPYLFLDNDGAGNALLVRGYTRSTFTPVDLNVYVVSPMTPEITLKFEYTYSHTYFYQSHLAGASVSMSL